MVGHQGQVFGNREDAGSSFQAVAMFDGVNDYILIPSEPGPMAHGGTLTVWFCAFAAGSGVLAARGATEDTGHFALIINDSRLQAVIRGPDGSHVIEAGAFGANEWNQSTVTWGAGGMKAYLNGELAGFDEITGDLVDNEAPWTFGAVDSGDSGVGSFFHGELDDIALYAQPLSDTEVRNLCRFGVEGLMTGESPADVDSGLDFSTIPVAESGPENLGTLDTPIPETVSEEDLVSLPESTQEPEPEIAPEATPESAPPENTNQAISIGEDGGVSIDGGDKLQW